MRKRWLGIAIAVCLALSLIAIPFSGCAAPATPTAPTPISVQDMELLGGGGFNYHASIAVAEILNKYNPWVRVSATETVSTPANAEMSRDRDPQSFLMCCGDGKLQATATLSISEFEGKEPITDLKWINGMNFGHHAFVTLDPNIRTVEDLDGKTVATMPAVTMKRKLEIAFELLGIDVTLKPMGFGEQYDALRDGTAAAAMWLSTGPPGSVFTPVPPLEALLHAKTVYGIPFPHELTLQLQLVYFERYGVPSESILAIALPGSLPTQTEPMEVWSDMTLGYMCKAEADEALIYSITETLVKHYYRLGEMMPALRHVTPSLMVQLMPLDKLPRYAKLVGQDQWMDVKPEECIHPGALRYYKDVGLWPQAWDRRGEVIVVQD